VSLEAPEPSEAMESFVFLCHAPNMTLSEEQLVEACLGSDAREPLGISSLGLVFFCPSLSWHLSQARAKGWARRCHRSGAQGSMKPSSPRRKMRSS
jgi:hypothetical protein